MLEQEKKGVRMVAMLKVCKQGRDDIKVKVAKCTKPHPCIFFPLECNCSVKYADINYNVETSQQIFSCLVQKFNNATCVSLFQLALHTFEKLG